jgi:hypothetical protein
MKAPAILAIAILAGAMLAAQQKSANPRVFVSDSQSWETSGGFAARRNGAVGASRGGARPQTAEIIKTVNETCKDVTVTMKQDNADYVLLLEHEGGKRLLRADNKYALFNKDGDAIKSGSTRALGNSVKDACTALMDDWKKKQQ